MPDVHPSIAAAVLVAISVVLTIALHTDQQTWRELVAALRSLPDLYREARGDHPDYPHLDEDTETWHG